MYLTDDPIADFLRHDREQQRKLDRRPKCANCDEPIQGGHFYMINDEPICPDCLESDYRKEISEYIE